MIKKEIIEELLNGRKIILSTEYNNNYKAVFKLKGKRLNVNSVYAALKELNNGERISTHFMIPNPSHDKKIYYSHEHKSLLVGSY